MAPGESSMTTQIGDRHDISALTADKIDGQLANSELKNSNNSNSNCGGGSFYEGDLDELNHTNGICELDRGRSKSPVADSGLCESPTSDSSRPATPDTTPERTARQTRTRPTASPPKTPASSRKLSAAGSTNRSRVITTRSRGRAVVAVKKRTRRSCPTDPLEASLRFHLERPDPATTKADSATTLVRSVRVRKSSTLADILPVLRERFTLQRPADELTVFSVTDFGESQLSENDRPLEILLKTNPTPKFVVRSSQSRTPYRDADVYSRRRQSRGFPVLDQVANERSPAHDADPPTSRTPDLVGDCRRKPLVLADPDADPLASWSPSGSKHRMAASDSNLDAILDRMTDAPHDNTTADPGRGRKKHNSGKISKRLRSRSREPENKDAEFKVSSKRGSSLRSSKSMSNIFQKTFSLRKKDHPYASPKTELSTEENSPGVLKIFGDSITPGANYKSVLAVSTSTAKELVKEAIERYGVPRSKSGMFVLCDVIGHFMDYSSDVPDSSYSLSPDHGLWTEECIRIIGDNERPLILQKYWKPAEGYARRFELRSRSELMDIEDADTSGVNANARRMLGSKSTSKQDLTTDNSLKPVEISRSPSPKHTSSRRPSVQSQTTNDDRQTPTPVCRLKPPTTCPYLISVLGYSSATDCVLYPIASRCVVIGSDKSLLTSNKQICLPAPDVLPRHCELRMSAKSEPNSEEGKRRSFSFQVDIVPSEDAYVTVNGIITSQPSKLNNGDMISLGRHYIFVYRDPHATGSPTPQQNIGDLVLNSGSSTDESSLWKVSRSQTYDSDSTRLKLSYYLDREDDLLQTIVQVVDDHSPGFRLTPAYLLAMAVEHSAAKHDQLSTRALLLKIGSKIHNGVLRRARVLAEKQPPHDTQSSTADNLLSDLCPVIQWLTNSLELLHHFRGNMSAYILDPTVAEQSGTRASIALAGDEVLGTLEEVVMYTFQQTVYYLTKALYPCLPALMDNNPFQDDSLPDPRPPVTDHVLTVYQIALEYLRDYKLHPQVVTQLFCYLFFFTSTSVFNSLMAKGSSEKYFRWSRGVQLRGNLDSLEAWAVTNDMDTEVTEYLKKLTSLVNLLATPKVQLIRSTWTQLRQAFPELNPRQLDHVLQLYEGGQYMTLAAWQPTPEDRAAMEECDLNESFNSHPPLVFPTGDYFLDLSYDVKDPTFHKLIDHISAKYGGPSGVDQNQTPESFADHRSSSRRSSTRKSATDFNPPIVRTQQPSMTSSRGQSTTSEASDAFTGRRLDSGYTSLNRSSSLAATSWAAAEDDGYGQQQQQQHHLAASPTQQHDLSFRPISAPLAPQSEPDVTNAKESRTSGYYSNTSCDSNEDTQLYMNVPYLYKRSDPHSLNSSISSQTSRDGKEVYQYMRTSLERRRPPPQPKQPAPLPNTRPHKHTDTTPKSHRHARLETADEKEIFVDDVINTNSRSHVVPLTLRDDSDKENQQRSLLQGTSSVSSHPIEASVTITTNTPSPAPSSADHKRRKLIGQSLEGEERCMEMFVVELVKGPMGYGMGLIDGLHTSLRQPGIYVRTLVEGSPAHLAGHLRLGDRILAVNGSSIIGADYPTAMQLIRSSGGNVQLTVTRSDVITASQIAASQC